MIFGEVFVPFDAIFWTEFFGLGPGFGFDANEFDVASVGVFLDKIVTKFVKKFEFGAGRVINDSGWRRKTETFAGREDDVRIIFVELICQRV